MHQIKGYTIAVMFILWSSISYAQFESNSNIQSRILILLDQSSSMIKPWADGQLKYKVADELIMRLMDSVYAVNTDVEFSLRVFGHQNTVEENNCYDTKNEVPFSKDNRTQMSLRLAAIRPLGVTPIAYSLAQAAEFDLTDVEHNAYSIILITDGGESCGGDICAIMKELIRKKVYFRPYIIGLEDDATLKTIYSCMGDYLQVTKNDDISRALNTIITAFHPLLKITKKEYKEVQAPRAPAIESQKEMTKKTMLSKLLFVKPSVQPFAYNVMQSLEKERFSPLPIPRLPAVKKDSSISSFEVTIPVTKKAQPVKLYSISISKPTIIPVKSPGPLYGPLLSSVGIPALPPVVKDSIPAPVVVKPAALKIPSISPAHLKPVQISTPKIAGGLAFPAVPATSLPPLVRDTMPDLAAEARPLPTEASADFKVVPVPAKETSLELYFVNEFGKYCFSRPSVLLIEHKTGKIERSFRREIDRLGNIDVQTKIPAGRYDIEFPTKHGLAARNILFDQRKKNKITVRVKDTKLSFAYIDASSRPVSEYKAVVTRLNAPPGQDRVEQQKCTQTIAYDPGTYKIEINSLPRIIDTTDFDFNEDTVIQILQPGYGKFTSVELPKHFVKLYCEKGGNYYFFYTLDVNDPEAQHLRLLPGSYQVRYEKGRKGTTSPELVVPFVVASNIETGVSLE